MHSCKDLLLGKHPLPTLLDPASEVLISLHVMGQNPNFESQLWI
jgi:hypothetical protein